MRTTLYIKLILPISDRTLLNVIVDSDTILVDQEIPKARYMLICSYKEIKRRLLLRIVLQKRHMIYKFIIPSSYVNASIKF